MTNIATAKQVKFNALVRTLNTCIETCLDAQKAYALASADVRDPVLKSLLAQRSAERAGFVAELQAAITKLGVLPENQGSARGMAHLGWVGLRVVLEGKDEWMIANECQKCETSSLTHYKAALEQAATDGMSAEVRAMLERHSASLSATLADLRHRYS